MLTHQHIHTDTDIIRCMAGQIKQPGRNADPALCTLHWKSIGNKFSLLPRIWKRADVLLVLVKC